MFHNFFLGINFRFFHIYIFLVIFKYKKRKYIFLLEKKFNKEANYEASMKIISELGVNNYEFMKKIKFYNRVFPRSGLFLYQLVGNYLFLIIGIFMEFFLKKNKNVCMTNKRSLLVYYLQ